MGIYDEDWKDKPAGYYADPKIRAQHDRKVRKQERFNRLVEQELKRLGVDERDIPTESEIEKAERRARIRF